MTPHPLFLLVFKKAIPPTLAWWQHLRGRQHTPATLLQAGMQHQRHYLHRHENGKIKLPCMNASRLRNHGVPACCAINDMLSAAGQADYEEKLQQTRVASE
jgi:hypothetical protein